MVSILVLKQPYPVNSEHREKLWKKRKVPLLYGDIRLTPLSGRLWPKPLANIGEMAFRFRSGVTAKRFESMQIRLKLGNLWLSTKSPIIKENIKRGASDESGPVFKKPNRAIGEGRSWRSCLLALVTERQWDTSRVLQAARLQEKTPTNKRND